jgi:hypothetical protein
LFFFFFAFVWRKKNLPKKKIGFGIIISSAYISWFGNINSGRWVELESKGVCIRFGEEEKTYPNPKSNRSITVWTGIERMYTIRGCCRVCECFLPWVTVIRQRFGAHVRSCKIPSDCLAGVGEGGFFLFIYSFNIVLTSFLFFVFFLA